MMQYMCVAVFQFTDGDVECVLSYLSLLEFQYLNVRVNEDNTVTADDFSVLVFSHCACIVTSTAGFIFCLQQ